MGTTVCWRTSRVQASSSSGSFCPPDSRKAGSSPRAVAGPAPVPGGIVGACCAGAGGGGAGG
eukprot:9501605-Lingulodinium_polyedra.AAC.1